jgi:hypothetical protein
MTSLKQIAANRRNALRSTGPVTAEGKQQSRCNAVRHGLTAETVIGTLDDAEDYQAFELAVTSGYEAHSAVERELVLRLASVLWRLRRATAIETALFEAAASRPDKTERLKRAALSTEPHLARESQSVHDMAQRFLRVVALPRDAFSLLTRYEHSLWRQARQLVLTLESLRRRQYANRRGSRPAFAHNAGYGANELTGDDGRAD